MAAASARSATLERRGTFSADLAEEWSAQASARFIRMSSVEDVHWAGKKVALYRSLPGEPVLHELEAFLLAEGASLSYPRVVDRASGEMRMIEVKDPAAENWQAGPYGLSEPPQGGRNVSPEELQLIVIPGAAFGAVGERIGMGAGYYDRFLSRARQALRISFAFEFQLYPALEQAEWDQPVDWVFTEARELRTPRADAWLRTGAVTR